MGMVALIRRKPVSPGFRRGLLFQRSAAPTGSISHISKPGAEAMGLRVHAATQAIITHDSSSPSCIPEVLHCDAFSATPPRGGWPRS